MILFVSFLLLYIMILLGNLLILSLVTSTKNLQSPIYIFLCSLSLSEIMFTTNLIPMFLQILLSNGSRMYINYCLAQFYLCASLGANECFLFAIMSYDRYIAICNPLHYASIMNLNFCIELIVYSWAGGFMSMLCTLIMVCQLNFCGPKTIEHFFCDFAPLMSLSCSDTFAVKMETFLISSSVTIFPFGFVIGTYVCIIKTILKIPTSNGRHKTFSTCSSHLTSVCTYYGTLIIIYVLPVQSLSSFNKVVSLIYTVITPLLNPIIYSLRNREIKAALQKKIKIFFGMAEFSSCCCSAEFWYRKKIRKTRAASTAGKMEA
ncbi:olfactory receptor 11L1-like [Pelobates fuscus]|uniref:olfactory receptor 11L1-like n=1 Tax=Pelobates fuscus TaxID=191477 RepID=UPI002FE4CDF0